MNCYSEFIVSAMNYVDAEIEKLNDNSVNKQRLHNNVKKIIVANVKTLAENSLETSYKLVDNIFRTQLNDEIVNKFLKK